MIYIFSFLVFFILLFVLKFFSKKLNLIDKPNYRKKHIGNIPLIGGLIIYLNILIFSFFIDISNHMNTVLLTSIILILLGALDDAIELGVNGIKNVIIYINYTTNMLSNCNRIWIRD